MTHLDYAVLILYFTLMAGIGLWSMLKIKKQEDFFLGGRGFGKILQSFAAFGAGTGSYDPVAVGRTTFTGGLAGIWSVMLWLFVTPFYWITGVWYRRMRYLTLGDWFVERYQSKAMGLAYAVFGLVFYMVYLSIGFSAIGKVYVPLLGHSTVDVFWQADPLEIKFVVVPIIAVVVLVYGILGGLRAAYWTDLIQGVLIIILSVLLIPAGLDLLVEKAADPQLTSTLDGFQVMHQQVPADYFNIVSSGGQFPWHYIAAITLLNLVGVVVMPHFIATGGGSAKSEMSARVGLVTGNFMKRFCTIGWALTALIVLALMADNVKIGEDPDLVWGVATREILGPFNLGLVGLMLACLLAALMSSADCYMLIVSALIVRNGYSAYVNPKASEKTCLRLGRLVGAVVIICGAVCSLYFYDVFKQLKIAWELPILFAAPFLVGMFWRRATKWAAWATVLFTLLLFFVVPAVLPRLAPDLADNPRYAPANDMISTVTSRELAPADVDRREAAIEIWRKQVADENLDLRKAKIGHWHPVVSRWLGEQGAALPLLGDERQKKDWLAKYMPQPEELQLGKKTPKRSFTGGKSVYWRGQIMPLDGDADDGDADVLLFDKDGKVIALAVRDEDGQLLGIRPVDENREQTVLEEEIEISPDDGRQVIRQQFRADCRLRGSGLFRVDFSIYDQLGIDLTRASNATLETLRLPTRIVLPFIVMILLSLITPRQEKAALDRYYVKMKTPVDPDPEADRRELELSLENPSRFDSRRLLKFGGLEMQRPTAIDVLGFVVSFVICFALIWLTVWLANFGG